MIKLSIFKNQISPFSINSSSLNETNKANVDGEKNGSLDFQSILKNISKEEDVTEIENQKSNRHNKDIKAEEEVDIDEDIVDKINYLVSLLLDIKSNYEKADDTGIGDILAALEKTLEVVELIPNNDELIYFDAEEVELLMNTIGQAKEVVKDIMKIDNLKDHPLTMKLENIMEQIEKAFMEDIKTVDVSSLVETKEDINFEENDLQLDNNLDDEYVAMEGFKVAKDTEVTESNINFTDDSLMEDGEAKANIEPSYTFDIFANGLSSKENSFNGTINTNHIQDYNKEELIQQIIEKIEFNESFDKQEVKIRLKPEYLGDLVLKMEVVEGSIQAKILVDNYRTKEIIESNLFQLRDKFEENNLEIKTFEVFVGTNEDFERERKNEHFFRRNPTKFKLAARMEEEISIYDSNLMNKGEKTYYEGRLNLFV